MQNATRWIGLAAVLTVLAAGGAPRARADIIIEYNSLASFDAALTGSSFVENNFTGFANSASYSGNGYGFTVSTVYVPNPSPGTNYLYPASGLTSSGFPGGPGAAESTNESGTALTFNSFIGSPNAVGGYFYSSDINGNMTPGSMALTVNGMSEGTVITGSASGPAPFTGFIDESGPITSVVATAQSFAYWPTADYVTVATGAPLVAAPEPATIIPASFAGLMALGYAGWRRKRTGSGARSANP